MTPALMTTAPAVATETPPLARIQTLDLLRGFAVLGMFLVHFHFYANELHNLPGNARTPVEEIVGWIVWLFVETKSHATFTFLFGAGFAVLLRRADARRVSFVPLYLRRLLVLALFGFVAHACFGYNVLLTYAYAGLWLLLVRNWRPRALVVAAVLCAVLPSLYALGGFGYDVLTLGRERAIAVDTAEGDAMRARARSVMSDLQAAEAQPSYGNTLKARLRHMRWFYTQTFFLIPGATLCLFLLGMLAIRCGVFEEPRRWARVIAGFMIFGVAGWAASRWLIPFWQQQLGPSLLAALVSGLGLVQEQWLAFTYIGALLLVAAYRSAWLRHFAPLAWVGRMALTNYLLQIAVMDVLFAGYGLHLSIREGMVVPATVLLFGAQIAFSRFWLTRFRYGPVEWLWRSLTYGNWSPMNILRS